MIHGLEQLNIWQKTELAFNLSNQYGVVLEKPVEHEVNWFPKVKRLFRKHKMHVEKGLIYKEAEILVDELLKEIDNRLNKIGDANHGETKTDETA